MALSLFGCGAHQVGSAHEPQVARETTTRFDNSQERMSGSCWYFGGYGDFQTERNVDLIQRLVAEHDLDRRGYLVWEGVGTADPVREQTLMQMDEMLSRDGAFPPEHLLFYQKRGGGHDFEAVREFMYNALPLFFQDTTA